MCSDELRLRVAVPTEGAGGIDAPRSAHFGHADSFTLVDVETGAPVEAGVVENPPHEHGGCAMTVDLLARHGVDAAIVVGIGPGPLAAMARHGINALFDGTSPTPREAAKAYIEGRLSGLDDDHVCRGH